MINEFIAVLAVFVVVNGFVLLILYKIGGFLKTKSKNEFMSKLNVYDEIIDSKINEIKSLEKKLDELSGNNKEITRIFGSKGNIIGGYNVKPIADYTDSRFFDNYLYLRDSFKLDYDGIINDFVSNVLNNNVEQNNIYNDILKKLDFDTKFSLMGKDVNGQIDELNKIFTDEESTVLYGFVNSVSAFKLSDFIEFIRNNQIINSDVVEIRLSKDLSHINTMETDERINFIIDENILEGLKIIYKNKVYDYSFGR